MPAAVSCGAEHVVRVGGELKQMITVSHLRVLPEHQRKGLWGAANRCSTSTGTTSTARNAYISVDNARHAARLRRHARQVAAGRAARARWTAPRWPGRRRAGRATPADAGEIVARLNAFHDAEEMFVPYTAAELRARG